MATGTLSCTAARMAHVQGEGGLAHGGTGRNDDKVRRLEPGGHLIKAVVACGDAGDGFLLLEAFGQLLKNAVDQLLGAFEDLAGGTFRDGKDGLFGLVQQGIHAARLVKAVADDVGTRADEGALQRLVADDGGIIFGIGPADDGLCQFRKVGRSAHCFELSMILEVAGYRNEIDGRVFAIEFKEAGVQRLVRGEVKIVGGKRVHERVEDAVTDKNTPQNGLFGLNAVGGTRRSRSFVARLGSAGDAMRKFLCWGRVKKKSRGAHRRVAAPGENRGRREKLFGGFFRRGLGRSFGGFLFNEVRLVFGDNLHGEGSDDVGMQTHADGVIAKGTDGMVEQDAATIHFDALSGQRIADDGGGHGAVELVIVAHAHDDRKNEAFQLAGDVVGCIDCP